MMSMLLAQSTAISDKQQQFLDGLRQYVSTSYEPSNALTFWIAVGVVVVVLVIVARHFTRRETEVTEPRRDHLLMVIDLLGLTEEDRRDLQRIARDARLREPAAMLLSPRSLACAIAAAPPDAARRKRLDSLARRMFGESLPAVV